MRVKHLFPEIHVRNAGRDKKSSKGVLIGQGGRRSQFTDEDIAQIYLVLQHLPNGIGKTGREDKPESAAHKFANHLGVNYRWLLQVRTGWIRPKALRAYGLY